MPTPYKPWPKWHRHVFWSSNWVQPIFYVNEYISLTHITRCVYTVYVRRGPWGNQETSQQETKCAVGKVTSNNETRLTCSSHVCIHSIEVYIFCWKWVHVTCCTCKFNMALWKTFVGIKTLVTYAKKWYCYQLGLKNKNHCTFAMM